MQTVTKAEEVTAEMREEVLSECWALFATGTPVEWDHVLARCESKFQIVFPANGNGETPAVTELKAAWTASVTDRTRRIRRLRVAMDS